MSNRTAEILALHSVTVDCLRSINDQAIADVESDATAQRLNEELADAVSDLAAIRTIPGTRDFHAKASAVCRYICATECDDDGNLPDDASLSTRAVLSVLRDLLRRPA